MEIETESRTGVCRYCGQSIIVRSAEFLTEEQLDECATMECGCEGARAYQENMKRRALAEERIRELFGDAAEEEFRQPLDVQELLFKAVDTVCREETESVTVTIRKGLKCKIAWTAAGKLKVQRVESRNSEFVQ